MKELIVETAGRVWQFLGENGEAELVTLPKHLKEKNETVFQSLGWLAREEKIIYSINNDKTFVKLADSELQIFQTAVQNTR